MSTLIEVINIVLALAGLLAISILIFIWSDELRYKKQSRKDEKTDGTI